MYANDASNFRQVPIGVVVPRTLDDVVETMRACARYRAPVLSRGGGTSLSGETVNNAVVIDFSKYLTEIGEIDVDRALVTAQTGVINEQLNRVTGKHGLVFGPDPSSHSRCTIGGNVGNNSCGIHSVQAEHYGPGPRTSDNTHALEIVTYEGERFWVGVNEEDQLDEIIAAGGRKGQIYAQLRDLRDRYADDIRAGYPSVDVLPRRVSGYNLDELLPEKGLQHRARPGRHRGDLRDRTQRHPAADPGAVPAHHRAGGLPRHGASRQPRHRDRCLATHRTGGDRPPAGARSAAQVAQHQVPARTAPPGHVCCGRPLYDYGFLDTAERYLHHMLDTLRDNIRAGTPIVGMEPSGLAVFKDELGKLLPHDDDAQRLARNAYHFAEFFTTFDITPSWRGRYCCGGTATSAPLVG
jgi:hypothetical protein